MNRPTRSNAIRSLVKSNLHDCTFLKALILRIIRDNKKLEISEKAFCEEEDTTLNDDEDKKLQLFKVTRN